MSSTRRQLRRGAVILSAVALLAACGGRGDPKASAGAPATAEDSDTLPTYTYAIDNKATGPAPAVAGAKAGGTIHVVNAADYTHLDPARIYVTTESEVSLLFSRQLTGYRQQGTNITLVGDLATDTGKTTDGGKTWKYTLRDGVSWEDGTPITSGDVKYGLERTFVTDYSEGPTYFQTWSAGSSDFHKFYDGPYDGKSLSTISTPNDKTLVIKFPKPEPDLPYAMAMTVSAPVKKAKDTRTAYDKKPFSSGPYRIVDHKTDKSMTLERNPNWKPESDPLRAAYPDHWEFEFGAVPLTINQRLIAASGTDASAITHDAAMSPEVRPQVMSTPDLKARSVFGFSLSPSYYSINMKRIPDIKVRTALLYAFPREQLRRLVGGPDEGEFASTVSGPSLLGHQQFDLFHAPPAGDPARAKQLLTEAGKLGQTVVYASSARPRSGQVAVIIDTALKEAGFNPVRKILADATAQDDVSRPDSEIDLAGGAWFPDWPSGSTMYPPIFDGRQIRKGGYNTSFLNDPAINAEMDQISLIVDPTEAGRRWSELEKKILAMVPIIPNLYDRNRQLYGPKIGGAHYNSLSGGIGLNGLYLKP